MPRLAAILVLIATTVPTAVHASDLTGGPVCELVEGIPGPNAPLRKARALKSILAAIGRPEATAIQMSKRFEQLETLVGKALEEASHVFHDTPRRQWAAKHKARAARFLERYVLGKRPLLQIGAVGFEPRPGLRAVMMYAACKAERHVDAIRWGRRASRPEEAPARAFSALLLLDQGQVDVARELVGSLDGPSFLTAWVRGELSKDTAVRRRQRAAARRRATTPAQRSAVAAQARRARSCQ
jgi:hypothetical protein